MHHYVSQWYATTRLIYIHSAGNLTSKIYVELYEQIALNMCLCNTHDGWYKEHKCVTLTSILITLTVYGDIQWLAMKESALQYQQVWGINTMTINRSGILKQ